MWNNIRKSFRKVDWKPTLISAVAGAVLFNVAVVIYLLLAKYEHTWIIYVGSFAFLVVMYYHALYDSKIRGHNESTVAMVFNSHVTTILGIIISCILAFILLAIFVPGYIGSAHASIQQEGEPTNVVKDNTGGLAFQVFLAATVINFSVGSFCGIIIPFTAKRNQMSDPRDPAPLHQRSSR